MDQDGYTRLREQGPLLGDEPQGPKPILLVDLEPGGRPDQIRRVPHSYLATVRAVVVRGATEEVDGLRAVLESIDLKVPCVRMHHTIGAPATLADGLSSADAAEFVTRARHAELRSLLNIGEAIWSSNNFHFVLPSGRHARTFIRPAHAIRSLRDAQVLALWLLEYVDSAGSGVVLDTHVLSSVIFALQLETQLRGVNLGKIRILDGYPATTVDTGTAIDSVTEELSSLLAIVSVCGTGGVRDMIASAAREAAFAERANIVSIFDVNSAGAADARQTAASLRIASLVHLGDPRDAKRYASYDSACALCERAETAQLVPVDLDTFDVRFPAFVEREMPSVTDPQRNRSLWEACHRSGAIGFEADPDEQVRVWRATGKMTWKVDWDRLLGDVTFRERVAVRLAEELRDVAKQEKSKGHTETEWNNFDLVLVPERDRARSGFDDFWSVVGSPFSAVAPIGFADHGPWADALYDQVRSARRILVLTLGTVTGSTLQRALNEIQRTRHDVDYDLHGLVIHARPTRRRLWQVLRNSYAHRLVAAFVTYVPDNFSPLREETKHLAADVSRLSGEAQEFFQKRLAICRGESVPDHGFLWGAAANESISPHSIFGDRLNVASTFMAVASALQARREAERSPPHRMLFEMPAIARSYYDPVIFACMLRWLQTPEIWWGDLRADAENVLGEVIGRAATAQRPLLVGEMLLAGAQGKIPQRGVDFILAQADALTNLPGVAPMLELGRELVRAKR